MSFIKRMFSSVGIGSAKVDTILDGDRFNPGQTLQAMVKITGGNVEQVIDEIYFSIHSSYKEEVKTEEETRTLTKTAVLDQFKLGEALVIASGEEKQFPVTFQLPMDTPITVGNTKVWIQTGLDIKRAVDPGDRDHIEIVPDPLLGALFASLNDLGFELVEADCEAAPHNLMHRLPFIQEFEFKPYQGPFRGRLDELELVCLRSGNGMDVFLEIDRKARGLSGFLAEMLDQDETRLRFTLIEDDLPNLTDHLYGLIDRWS